MDGLFFSHRTKYDKNIVYNPQTLPKNLSEQDKKNCTGIRERRKTFPIKVKHAHGRRTFALLV